MFRWRLVSEKLEESDVDGSYNVEDYWADAIDLHRGTFTKVLRLEVANGKR